MPKYRIKTIDSPMLGSEYKHYLVQKRFMLFFWTTVDSGIDMIQAIKKKCEFEIGEVG